LKSTRATPARDALTGLAATAALHHPPTRVRIMAFHSVRARLAFSVSAATAPGQWDVLIDPARDGERVFRSRNRIVLHSA